MLSMVAPVPVSQSRRMYPGAYVSGTLSAQTRRPLCCTWIRAVVSGHRTAVKSVAANDSLYLDTECNANSRRLFASNQLIYLLSILTLQVGSWWRRYQDYDTNDCSLDAGVSKDTRGCSCTCCRLGEVQKELSLPQFNSAQAGLSSDLGPIAIMTTLVLISCRLTSLSTIRTTSPHIAQFLLAERCQGIDEQEQINRFIQPHPPRRFRHDFSDEQSPLHKIEGCAG